jgi:hypothetical protein
VSSQKKKKIKGRPKHRFADIFTIPSRRISTSFLVFLILLPPSLRLYASLRVTLNRNYIIIVVAIV